MISSNSVGLNVQYGNNDKNGNYDNSNTNSNNDLKFSIVFICSLLLICKKQCCNLSSKQNFQKRRNKKFTFSWRKLDVKNTEFFKLRVQNQNLSSKSESESIKSE